MRRPLVLHVDPHADTRDLLACMLRVHAVDVVGVDNGRDAYETAVRERPDAIVTELAVPFVDGCSLCLRVRQTSGLAQIPVIAWTGWMVAGSQEAAAQAGFNRILVKAGTADIVRELLSLLRARRAAG
ncbi:MAG: response regulator [Bacteroidales bacterium]